MLLKISGSYHKNVNIELEVLRRVPKEKPKKGKCILHCHLQATYSVKATHGILHFYPYSSVMIISVCAQLISKVTSQLIII